MPIEAGEAVLPGDVSETRTAGTGATAGVVVMLDGDGDMVPADTEVNDLAGVVVESGDDVLGISGAYVAAADAAVVEGNRVNAGNATGTSTGEFIADSAGLGLALSDTGGTWQGHDVPAGHAVVYLP